MKFGRYRFVCRLRSEALLPPYKGSTFRGILGHALKKVSCTLKQQECRTCLLASRCVYACFFEDASPSAKNASDMRLSSPPKPYVLEPPDNDRIHFDAGESLEFRLLLFGEADAFLPYLVYAFKYMGELGVGKRVNGKRAGFVLESVHTDAACIYTSETDILRTAESSDLTVNLVNPAVERTKLTIEFQTPVRMKFKNTFAIDAPFHVLVRALLRRISSLEEYHGNGEPMLDYRGLVAGALDVETVESDLTWLDWRRYSNRQDREMLMGGITGRAAYEGDLGPYMNLFRYGEVVHIGKQTSFGLGKFRIVENPGERP